MTLLLSSACNLGVLDSLSESEILDNWNTFCLLTQTIINNNNDDDASMSSSSNLQSCVSSLCKYGDGGLRSLVQDHFLLSLQVVLEDAHNSSATHFVGDGEIERGD
nr:anaphase-promoting complex subunit 2 [Tanacetum cinerariifolium]